MPAELTQREPTRRELTQGDIENALNGQATLIGQLVDELTPIVQARVARTLLRWGGGRDIRQEVEDFTQDVFLALFDEDGRILRGWQPDRGLSLQNYVGLVAERQSISILRSGKRSPWKEDPTLSDELDSIDQRDDPEQVAAARQKLRLLWWHMTEQLSPLGRQLFDLLFIQEKPVEEVVRITDMSPDSLYAWRSRLRRLAKKLAKEIHQMDEESLSDPTRRPRKP